MSKKCPNCGREGKPHCRKETPLNHETACHWFICTFGCGATFDARNGRWFR